MKSHPRPQPPKTKAQRETQREEALFPDRYLPTWRFDAFLEEVGGGGYENLQSCDPVGSGLASRARPRSVVRNISVGGHSIHRVIARPCERTMRMLAQVRAFGVCIKLKRSRVSKKWRHARLGIVDIVGAMQELHTETRMMHSVQEAGRRGGATTVVGSLAELSRMPMWMQGDDSLNTEDVIELRAKLRIHPDVVEQLQLWWNTAQNSMRQAHGADYEASAVTRNEYVKVSRLLSKVMLEEFDEDQAQQCAEEDFATDAKGQETLSREQFMNAIYECAHALRWSYSFAIAFQELRLPAHPCCDLLF